MPFKARKAVFEKLEEIADVASLSKEERERYQNSVNVYRTHLCVMDAAKEEGREEGRQEGREEGLKEGLKKGHQEGHQEGLKEGREEERLIIVRNLKSAGMSDELIAKATGVSLEEIRKL